MNSSVKNAIKGIVVIICTIFFSGCAYTLSTTKVESLASDSKLLIMPPRDVVQFGRPHPMGQGSGDRLQKSLHRELNILSNYEVVIIESNDIFNNTIKIKKEDAIAKAKKIGVDYCLLLTLGEFRDAAPMTFRSDYVFLEDGILINVNTKKEVWSLNKPLRLDKPNIGNHLELIDDIAKSVAMSIVEK